MDIDIDLTEHGDFRDKMVISLGSRNRIAWRKRNISDFQNHYTFNNISLNGFNISYNSNSTYSTTSEIRHGTSTTNINSHLLDYDSFYDVFNRPYYYLGKDHKSIFPTGNVEYIKSHRLDNKKKRVYNRDFYDHNFKMSKKEVVRFDESSVCWRSKFIRYRIHGMNIKSQRKPQYMYDDLSVPCLSRRIRKRKNINTNKYNYPICWYEYLDSNDYEQVDKSKYVYYKDKTKLDELNISFSFRRSRPWQPNGRVSQNYDTLFDSMNWREMLNRETINIEERMNDNGIDYNFSNHIKLIN